jgi:glutamate-5-semialdehyde dehydrogenase
MGDADFCAELGRRARAASRLLSTVPETVKNDWLTRAADMLENASDAIIAANATDKAAAEHSLTKAQVDRLRLTPNHIKAAASGLREIAALADPIGRVIDERRRPNGLVIRKIGVPIGVLLFLYESRPNVTVDAAGLAVKSGNAIILRGGKEALHSNSALYKVVRESLIAAGLPPDSVQLVSNTDREMVGQLLQLNEFIDLVIPRGGESLVRRVSEEATMPVLKHYRGNCHVYVNCSADPEMAIRIVVNAKCQRPGVCNAMESLLVDREVAPAILPALAKALMERGVEISGCEETCRLVPGAKPASEQDYEAEYLALILSTKMVNGVEEAIAHINRYGSHHTDAIVTEDLAAARRFCSAVDSAAVMVNASTRFHDGHEFGMGAEIGISTDKLHARGPCGLQELTTYKYVVQGSGQIRE